MIDTYGGSVYYVAVDLKDSSRIYTCPFVIFSYIKTVTSIHFDKNKLCGDAVHVFTNILYFEAWAKWQIIGRGNVFCGNKGKIFSCTYFSVRFGISAGWMRMLGWFEWLCKFCPNLRVTDQWRARYGITITSQWACRLKSSAIWRIVNRFFQANTKENIKARATGPSLGVTFFRHICHFFYIVFLRVITIPLFLAKLCPPTALLFHLSSQANAAIA